MFTINLKNIEELIFNNKEVRFLLNDFSYIFDQWFLSQRVSFLRTMRLQSLIDLINALNEQHLEKLKEYFGDTIIIDRIDYNITKHVTFNLNSDIASKLSNDITNFTISRNKDHLYLTSWR